MRILLLLISCFATLTFHSQETPRVGATSMPGLLMPNQVTDEVKLERVLVEFKGFSEKSTEQKRKVPYARFSVHYSFKNLSSEKQTINATVPNTMVFTEFDREHRSLVLDNIAALIPGVFDLQGDGNQIRQEMEQMFDQRAFIRRFMNVRDLGNLNMEYRITKGGSELNYRKAEVEFRWTKAQGGGSSFLEMEINQQLELTFNPKSTTQIRFDFVVPAFTVGDYGRQYYVPLSTAGAADWAGKIDQLYFMNIVNEATQALPYYFEYDQRMMNEDLLVSCIENHEPERNERVAFYATKYSDCGCYKGDAVARSIFIPHPVTNVSASSWYQNQYNEDATCFVATDEVAVFSNLPLAIRGLDGTLGFTGNALEVNNHTTNILSPLAERNCDVEQEPYLTFTKGYHPAWAFDNASDSLTIGGKPERNTFTIESAWCAAGGKGEWLEFEVTQPVNEIKFYTGIRGNSGKYKKFGRVKMMEIVQQNGNFRKLIVLSDIITSSYVVSMPAGKYRMNIMETYPGVRYDATCLSKVQFMFDVGDQWLESIINKPKK